jgi:ABC-type tungstate transport system substrate-binding protein
MGLSQWFHRLVDLALVSLAIALVLNLVLLALRRG